MKTDLMAVIQLLAMLLADPRSAVLVGLLVAAGWSDYCTGRIPNPLVFGGAFLGLAYNAFVPMPNATGLDSLGLALGGMVFGLVLTLPFYLLRAMGAGDVKLMAMCGAFLGYPAAFGAVIGSFLAGGAMALIYLIATGRMRQALSNIATLGIATATGGIPTINAKAATGTLPYGVAIAVGTIAFLAARQLGFIH